MSTINSDLESMHNEDNVPLQNNVNDNRTADLEMAVLVQVLLHIYISNLELICVNIISKMYSSYIYAKSNIKIF